MRRKFLSAFAAVAAVSAAGCATPRVPSTAPGEVAEFAARADEAEKTCSPPDAARLDVPLRPQETSMWCWAASGEMCMDFLGRDVNQCDQAKHYFGHDDCCTKPTPERCVAGGWPQFNHFRFTAKTTTNAALPWETVKSEIGCGKRPIAFTWHWNGGGGHMMVLIGYEVEDGERYVWVHDPWEPFAGDTLRMRYDWYVSGDDHTHWDDYYEITKY